MDQIKPNGPNQAISMDQIKAYGPNQAIRTKSSLWTNTCCVEKNNVNEPKQAVWIKTSHTDQNIWLSCQYMCVHPHMTVGTTFPRKNLQ